MTWNGSSNVAGSHAHGNSKKIATKPFVLRGLSAVIFTVAVGVSALFWLIWFLSQCRKPVDASLSVSAAAESSGTEHMSPVVSHGETTGANLEEDDAISARRHKARRRLMRRKLMERQDSLPRRDDVGGEEANNPLGKEAGLGLLESHRVD